MGTDTKIEWAHHTFNPWSGCEKVSAGCANCYAAALPPGMRRGAEWGKDRPRVVASESYWRQPLTWNRAAAKAGERHRVFCASTADVFEANEELDDDRARLFFLIKVTPHLDWLLLTKRPEYAVEWWRRQTGQAWPANAWIGTSVEDQRAADARIPYLLGLPARVRFLSMEPLLGAVAPDLTGISWVIVGGESGRHARPMHPEWARSLRDQCTAAGVAFFFKQWGEFHPFPHHGLVGQALDMLLDAGPARGLPTGWPMMARIGKAAAGRLLDGREWSEVPDAR